MRIASFHGSKIYVASNLLTPLFYRKQFDRDFLSDALEWLINQDPKIGNKIAWALSKSYDFELLEYDQWLNLFEIGETNWDVIELELLPFFKKTTTQKKDTEKKSGPENFQEIKLVAGALRFGLPLEFLKLIHPTELMELFDDSPRTATQEDIDRFLA